MYRKKSLTKRQEIIFRTALYAGMTISVLAIVASIVFFALMGYRLDQENGHISRGALIQFGSTPSGANVTIDGNTLSARTPTKHSLVAGNHDLKVTRDGYRDWSKSLVIQAGTLTWLNNIRLIPNQLETEAALSFGVIKNAITSGDNRMLLTQEDPAKAIFEIANLRSLSDGAKTIALATSMYSQGSNHIFTPTSWDDSGRYVMLKHRYDDTKLEWLIVDTQRVSESVNVSRLLQVQFDELRFSGSGITNLYGTTNGSLRQIDAENGTLSKVLVSKVVDFDIFNHSFITYVGVDPTNAEKKVAGVYRSGDDESTVLREGVAKDSDLAIATARYFNDTYIAIAESDRVVILRGDFPNPEDKDKVNGLEIANEFTVNFSVKELSFSGKGSYLAIRGDKAFTGYEIEFRRQVESAVSLGEVRWFDDVNVWTVQNGTLVIQEYDGANRQELVPVALPIVSLSSDDRYLYTINKQGDSFRLEQTRLIL